MGRGRSSSWSTRLGRTGHFLAGMPGSDVDHGTSAAGANRHDGQIRFGGGLLLFELFWSGLQQTPGLTLLRGEDGSLSQQGPDAVAPDFAGGMKPAEQAHPAKPFGQDMLEKAADQFGGGQGDGLVLAGVRIAVRPEDFARVGHLQEPIAGGSFEDVTGQVSQSIFTGADGLTIHRPFLFPDFGGQWSDGFGGLFFQLFSEEGAKMQGQGFFGQEEFGTTGNPLALVQTQSAARDQVMDMWVEDQGARPGMKNAQHAQVRAEAFGVGG